MVVAMSLPKICLDSENCIYSIITNLCGTKQNSENQFHIKPDSDPTQPWIHVIHAHTIIPKQGWKLHISSSVFSAESVLHHVLPLLLRETANFKVAGSLAVLDYLNQGGGGFTQIGKFITVYPNDEAQAIRLAIALDQATRDQNLFGPAIPSDRPLLPGSLVHYRYGGFDDRFIQTPLGEILPALSTPEGELVPDRRQNSYYKPDWVQDPFVAAGITTDLPAGDLLLAGRYLLLAMIHRSPRGALYLALDIVAVRNCIIKRASHSALADMYGRDARDRLRHEANVLNRLAPDSRFPAPFDLFELDDDLYLVMEEVAGETLEQHIAGLMAQGRLLSGEQAIIWGIELAAALSTIHDKGFIYRDLKSTNVVVAPDGQLRLLDFEAAYDIATQGQPFCYGTRGYVSLQQDAGLTPSITDDVYSLGVLLYLMVTGCEPSAAPHSFNLLHRPVELLNPTIGAELVGVIARCLDPDPARRYPSMTELISALTAIGINASLPPPPFGGFVIEPEDGVRERSRTLARRLGDTLCQVVQPAPDGHGAAWMSSHPAGSGMRSRDINIGNSGTLLALTEIVAAFDDVGHKVKLAQAAHWLATTRCLKGSLLPGLYVGEAGVGAALLRAGQVLSDEALIAAALERGEWVAAQPYISPDLFHGIAGRLRFHLFLWDETKNPSQLRAAIAAGEALLEMAEISEIGEWRWKIPAGYDGLSGGTYLGYAHGAAGIADALLDLFEASRDKRFLSAAQGAGRWLMRLAVPTHSCSKGLAWPDVEGERATGAFWCRGAAGVGQFFLHAAACHGLPEAEDIAGRAARTVARLARAISPTQCHGLAGNIEFLLDLYQATTEAAYLVEARSLARLLESFGTEYEGRLVWPSETPTTFTPDYMVGYAGVAICLLRLSEPESRPRQLSRRGFRYC